MSQIKYSSYIPTCQFDKKPLPNNPMTSSLNYGVSSRLKYDNTYVNDRTQQSTAPLQSKMDPNRTNNCNKCSPNVGSSVRPSHNGWQDNLPVPYPNNAPAQQVTDIESVLTNRNVKKSRDKTGGLNPVNPLNYKTYDNVSCGKGLDTMSSILTFPKQFYREMSINRFYDLNINPQVNIYWDNAENTRLTAKDNYSYPYPFSLDDDMSLPTPTENFTQKVAPHYNFGCNVPVFDKNTYPKINKTLNPDYYQDTAVETDSDSEN
jgi:hypothetical protein